jgi:hypothetical protein
VDLGALGRVASFRWDTHARALAGEASSFFVQHAGGAGQIPEASANLTERVRIWGATAPPEAAQLASMLDEAE